MQPISESDIKARLQRDNPWRTEGRTIPEAAMPKRIYYEPFAKLALNFSISRATVLMGPRRVGKTVMARQLVQEAIDKGIPRENILYISVDTPVYAGYPLEKFLSLFRIGALEGNYLVLFDEIQYLKDWELHLKDLVDSYKNVKFVATGSAAAALRLKSAESGAGRFTEFMLPPLTFYEFLYFKKVDGIVFKVEKNYRTDQIDKLNDYFVEYLNYGGYPEVVLNDGRASKETPGSTLPIRAFNRTDRRDSMSTSTKTPASIRQGGPGASHQNAKKPLEIDKPPADSDQRKRSNVSGGGGERDSHHTRDPKLKGGSSAHR